MQYFHLLRENRSLTCNIDGVSPFDIKYLGFSSTYFFTNSKSPISIAFLNLTSSCAFGALNSVFSWCACVLWMVFCTAILLGSEGSVHPNFVKYRASIFDENALNRALLCCFRKRSASERSVYTWQSRKKNFFKKNVKNCNYYNYNSKICLKIM